MGRTKGSRNYPLAFKRQVVVEALSAPSIAAVARRRGLSANMVRLWCKDERFRPVHDPSVVLLVEIVEAGHEEIHRAPAVLTRIEITTRSGHRLVVTDAEDPGVVADLVRALEAV